MGGRNDIDYAAAERLAEALRGEDPPDEPLPEVPGFVLERRLGGGGGGEVYLARRQGSDRRLALKLCRPGGSHQRAWRELALLKDLRLAGVPRLIDYGVQRGQVYLAYEYVEGEPLLEHCEHRGLGRRERVALLAELADVVHALHERGVIHRDLKPSNVIVGADGRPVVVDFGIARLLESGEQTLTEPGMAVGSPAFMSPEQARGDARGVSTRSDVYSLGATAYCMLAGRTPHATDTSLGEAIRRVGEDEPAHPRSLDPTLPRPLAAVLARAVAREPARRYPSAAAFAADLRRWLAGEPVQASPPGPLYRAQRAILRRPLVSATVLGLIIAAGIVAGTGATILWLNRRPMAVVVDPESGRWARLISHTGRTLRTWRSSHEGWISLAEVVPRPPELGGGRIVLTMGRGFLDAGRADSELCAWDARRPQRLLWSSADARPQTPGGPIFPGESYLADRRGIVADVFAESPGLEVIVAHTHSSQDPTCLRVYRLDGEVLYEAWHWGSFMNLHWAAEAGVLVGSGCNNEKPLQDRGYEVDYRWPKVVGAVRPRLGVNEGWLNGPRAEGDSALLWYRYIEPIAATPLVDVVLAEPSERERRGWAVDVNFRLRIDSRRRRVVIIDSATGEPTGHVVETDHFNIAEVLDPESVAGLSDLTLAPWPPPPGPGLRERAPSERGEGP